ncbi:MAG: IclR family transcriptional regulator [Bacilli bacterium]
MPINSEQKNYRAPGLEKGLDILEALSEAMIPQSLTNLSRTLNRSSSELFRMVDCLEKRGYIVKEEDSGNYMLSLKLFQLAHTHTPMEQLKRAASRPMRELAQHIQESCHLSVLYQGKLIVLSQEESPKKLRLSIEVGGQFSAIHTVSGRILLSHLPLEEQRLFLESDEDYLAMNKVDQHKIQLKLEEIRERGYATAENESLLGIRDFAVIVGNPPVEPVAALAVSFLQTANSKQQGEGVLAALRNSAKSIYAAMGGTT